jgi:hypothetical protein
MRIIIVSISLLMVNYVLAQQWKDVIKGIPSPNATALGTYGEVPISYFTGLPNIDLPLYSFKTKKFAMPVSLSYHAQGVRPESMPGWVGMGWNLNVGGVITRIVNKIPDEKNLSGAPLAEFPEGETWEKGFYFTGGVLSASDWSSNAKMQNASNVDYKPNIKDLEPDYFQFNFMGISGKFFLDQNRKFRVQSNRNIKVEFIENDFIQNLFVDIQFAVNDYNIKPFRQFVLIDEQGNRYTFGGSNNAIEYSGSMVEYSPGSSFIATSWYLVKIESHDGTDIVNLEYERGPFISNVYFGPITQTLSFRDSPYCDNATFNGSASKRAGSIIAPLYLKKISSNTTDIELHFNTFKSNGHTYNYTNHYSYVESENNTSASEFLRLLDYTTGINYFSSNPTPAKPNWKRFIWLKLNFIEVKTRTDNILKKRISLVYDDDIPIETNTRKLQLGVVQIGLNNNIKEKYLFQYNNTLTQPLLNATYTDHWGFANGKPTSIGGGYLSDIGNNRAVDVTKVQAEILTQITYPTGGTTNFEYEPNNYAQVVDRFNRTTVLNEAGLTGGIRVKRIINDAKSGAPTTIRDFYYVRNYTNTLNISTATSSGILNAKPVYAFDASGLDAAGYNFSNTITTSSNIYPLTAASSGMHIGYSEVIEKRSDGSYTKYFFTNHDIQDNRDDSYINIWNKTNMPYVQYNSKDFERGQLLKKEDYDFNNVLINKTTNIYSRVASSYTQNARAIAGKFDLLCKNTGVPLSHPAYAVYAVSRVAFENYDYAFLPTTNSTQLRSQISANEITTTTNMVYDSYKNIIEQTVTNSKGELLTTKYTYPYQYPNSTIYMGMKDANKFEPIEVTEYITKGGNLYLKKAMINKFDYVGNNAFAKYEEYISELPEPILANTYTYYSVDAGGSDIIDARCIKKVRLAYDLNANIATVSTNQSDNTSIKYDYFDSKIVSITRNTAEVSKIAYTSFETNNQGDWIYSFPKTDPSGIFDDETAPTGKKVFKFDGNASTTCEYTNEPTLGTQLVIKLGTQLDFKNKYIISMWAKPKTALPIICADNVNAGAQPPVVSVWTEKMQIGSWKLIEATISNTTDIGLLGAGVSIDELRIYPITSQMTTYTYDVNNGVTSVCDPNNNITYYEYDDYNRLKFILDKDRNILKRFSYNYTGETIDSY